MGHTEQSLPGMTPKEKPLPPSYAFAGINIGGEMAYECGQCGCLLKGPKVETHTHWHAQQTCGSDWC